MKNERNPLSGGAAAGPAGSLARAEAHAAESQPSPQTVAAALRLAHIRRQVAAVACIFAALFVAAALLAEFSSLTAGLAIWGAGALVLLIPIAFILRAVLQEDSRKARRIKERDRRYRETLAILPEGVVILGENWTIDWTNERAAAHLGIGDDRTGERFFDVARDLGLDPAFERWLLGGDYSSRFILTRPEENLVLEVAAVVPDSRHALIVTHDVTERRRMEDMRKDFVANVSHELRTPLTVISGFLEMEGAEGEKADPALAARHRALMVEQTRRMRSILEDLLTLSGLENSDEPGIDESVVIAMPKLVDDVVREGMALSRGRHEITMHAEDLSLIGQPEEIRSACMNLVSNAVRYTPEGGRIEVRWERAGTGARFSVKDTGIGIEAKHIPRLTERFYRADKGRSRATGGTGLGLAIVKHVLRRNGGELEIASTPGKGSTFSMHFPEARVFRTE